MSIASPRTSTSKRFFLSLHRYISLPSCPSSLLTHHPLHARSTSTSSTPPPASPPPSAPSPPTYYALFPHTLPHGPPPSGPFSINGRQLRTEYLTLQSRSHPDLHQHSASTASTKARAEGTSAYINAAYRTLLSPLLRAQYLLSLRGVEVGDEAEGMKLDDEDLLSEVLEVREEIEGVEEEGELDGLRGENEGRIGRCERALEEAFREDDVERAKGEAVRLRYWVNIREALDGWEKGKPVVIVH